MQLTHKNAQWNWTAEHQQAFINIKNALQENGLSYYDPARATKIIVDASPVGVAAILTQTSSKGKSYIISYASRALSEVEQRYSQIERETLAIVFGCEKYKLYILGKPARVITDHKPLIPMFTKSKIQLPN